MCSFLVAGFLLANMTALFNEKMQRRGPDLTTRVVMGGLEFVHNLLHLTGPMTQQPLLAADGSAAAVFNGEIYNHDPLAESLGVRAGASDGEVLIPAYKRWGARFVRQLDGEFALAVADTQKQRMLVATDTFGTKPLWLARSSDGRWAVASYRSALINIGFSKVSMVGPNTVLECHLPLLDRCIRIRTFRFDLRQFKLSSDDWRRAFSVAVAKRTLQGASGPRPNLFLGLSSGHDSGAIHAEVLNQRRPHAVYAILGPEAPATLEDRIKLAEELDEGLGWASSAILALTNEQWWWEKAWLTEHAELYETVVSEQAEDGIARIRASDDEASEKVSYAAIGNPSFTGLSAICRQAAASGRRVMLNGQGADETMTNYADRGRPLRDHFGRGSFGVDDNDFNGFYPEQLSTVFPWKNFFRGANRDFLQTVEAA